jgi:hypothetical protein
VWGWSGAVGGVSKVYDEDCFFSEGWGKGKGFEVLGIFICLLWGFIYSCCDIQSGYAERAIWVLFVKKSGLN